MTDEREVRPGFLPPKAPGAQEPPRFEAPERPEPPNSRPPSSPASPPSAPALPPSSPVPPPASPPPEDRPVFVRASDAAGPANGLAVSSMVVASISLLLLVFSIGVGYPLCLLLGLLAFGMAVRAHRSPNRPRQARAARVLAAVAVIAAVVAGVVWLSLEASGFTPEELQRRLETWLEDQLQQRRTGGAGEPEI